MESGTVNRGNYHATRHEAWSDATCIRTTTADGIAVVNRTKYSSTTTRHQTEDAAFWRGKPNVIVTTAQRGAGPADLLELAQEDLRELRAGVA